MTRETASFNYTIHILATPEQVFEAIVKPELAAQYWAHENVSDWKPGSAWQHVGADKDRVIKLVGKVIEYSPPERLVMSWANPEFADNPDKVSRVTISLEPFEAGIVRLDLAHDELEAGSGMLSGISRGWPIVLSSLKSWLETGKGLDVFAKPRGCKLD